MIKINTSIFRDHFKGEEVFVGMEYVNDTERVPVFVKFKFRSSAVFKNINFDNDNLHVRQLKNGEILCTLEKNISKKLFTDICNLSESPDNIKKTNNFILGFIYGSLGLINNRILEEKYKYGLFLVKPISIFDIYEIGVINKKDEGGMAVWPIPYNINLNLLGDEIYNKDFIDAITSYLTFYYDDCIRKLITSLENFFRIDEQPKKINIFNFFKNKNKFSQLLKEQLISKNYFIEQHNGRYPESRTQKFS